jgi:hypothetical protein
LSCSVLHAWFAKRVLCRSDGSRRLRGSRFLVELNDLHRHILCYRASAPAQTDLIEDGLLAFEAMLADMPAVGGFWGFST